MPTAPKSRATKACTTCGPAIAEPPASSSWKFEPSKLLGQGYTDTWFLSCLAAVANDLDGPNRLSKNITRKDDGYQVKFPGLPNIPVTVLDDELKQCLDTRGGQPDTRLLELAADKVFKCEGAYKKLYLAAVQKAGLTKAQADKSFELHCFRHYIKDPLTFNPMHSHGSVQLGLYLLTGKYADHLLGDMTMKKYEFMKYLEKHVKKDWDHPSVVISGRKNMLGSGRFSRPLAVHWDAIRTDIISDGKVDTNERNFLNALDQYLKKDTPGTLEAVVMASQKLRLKHADPTKFLNLLDLDWDFLKKEHLDLLRYGIHDILYAEKNKKNTRVDSNDRFGRVSGGDIQGWSGLGFIGFGGLSGYLTGFNVELDTFTYSEPNFPTMQHQGILSRLIAEIQLGEVALSSVEPESINCPVG